ncbi:DUF4838 domain-containing protein [bacterium]|nr:DUF4838 domain-containing protein [bacterium]
MKQTLILMASLMLLGASSCASTRASASAAAQKATIVVNLGSFATPQKALDARTDVEWSVHEGPDTIICTEALAALELQQYLAKMNGSDISAFPIVDDDQKVSGPMILVGNPGSNKKVAALADKLGLEKKSSGPDQSYRILGSPEDNALVLAGADRTGTLYAAYRYLDLNGVRWFAPGEANEEVPQVKFEIKKMDLKEQPGYTTRGFYAWEDRGTPAFIEWMGRNRMNFWTVEQSDPTNCKMRGILLTAGQHALQTQFLNPNMTYPYYVPQFPASAGRPADPYKPGKYQGNLNDDDAISYSEVHPEWYGMRNGKRQFDFNTDWGTNICDSNDDAVHELMKNIVDALINTKWQYADSINMWMFDGADRWCRCDKCKALGSLTDRNFRIVYALQKELEKAKAEGRLKRDVMIGFLAYDELIEPPTKPLPADFDFQHMWATYFPILRCYVHRFDDPKCTELNREYFKQYQGWIGPDRKFTGPLFIGEYYNVSRFHHLPIVFDEIQRADIPYFYKTGARAFHYMHVPVANWGTRSLTQWQLSRMLWNPDIDVDALLNDYYTGRYGPAADQMRKVYASLRTALSNCHEVRMPMMDTLNAGKGNLFEHKHMQYVPNHPADGMNDGPAWPEMLAALKQARVEMDKAKTIQVPDRIKSRLAEDDALIVYAQNQMGLYDCAVRATMALEKGDKATAKQAYEESLPIQAALKADTKSSKYGSSHTNRPDGLQASRITGALARIEKAVK